MGLRLCWNSQLFDSLDDDGGGSLDLAELKPTLKRLMDAAENAETEIKELSKSSVTLRKAAKTKQKVGVCTACEYASAHGSAFACACTCTRRLLQKGDLQ